MKRLSRWMGEAIEDSNKGSIRGSVYGDQPMRFELVIY